MDRNRRVIVQVIMALGLVITLDDILPIPTLDARADTFLNLKPGAWETTTTMTSSGSKLPPELAATLTPEQRTKMEESFKSRDAKPRTRTKRSCLTKEDIDHDRILKDMKDEDGEETCTVKVISKTSSKVRLDRVCSGRQATTIHLTIEAKTPESYVVITDGDAPGLGKIHAEGKGRWLSASCAGIENED